MSEKDLILLMTFIVFFGVMFGLMIFIKKLNEICDKNDETGKKA
ncbi:hypothetical protein [Campylobacter vulpis]|nr:hypothetical protein [Campylobacter vulpis]